MNYTPRETRQVSSQIESETYDTPLQNRNNIRSVLEMFSPLQPIGVYGGEIQKSVRISVDTDEIDENMGQIVV